MYAVSSYSKFLCAADLRKFKVGTSPLLTTSRFTLLPARLRMFLKLDMGVDCSCLFTWIVVIVVLVAYIFWDVNYFLRILFTVGWALYFEKRVKPNETTQVYGICTTNDLDVMFKHMNNARYLRDLDFARFHFYVKCGLYDIIRKTNAHALQTATNIRYRRTIPLFHTYKITTRIVYWDEKTMYLEQQFVTLRDGFVRAVVFSKQNVIGLNFAETIGKMLNEDASYRPPMLPELKTWLQSMEQSSDRLKKKED